MKETSYWDRFYTSGAVEDYLRFKSESRSEASRGTRENAESAAGDETRYRETDSAGLCNDDGNGYKDIARG